MDFDILRGYYGFSANEKRTRRIARRNSPLHMWFEESMNDARNGREYGFDLPLFWPVGFLAFMLGGCLMAVKGETGGLTGGEALAGVIVALVVPILVIAPGYFFTRKVPAKLAKDATAVSTALRRLHKLDPALARQGREALQDVLAGLGRPDWNGLVETHAVAEADLTAMVETIEAHIVRVETAVLHATCPIREHRENLALEADARRLRAQADRYAGARARAAAFTAEHENILSDIEWYRDNTEAAELTA